MPSMVPTQSIHVARPNPKGHKDKEGNVIHDHVRPKIGEPFDFTDEELDDINRASPGAVREPINEGSEGGTARESAEDQAAREAVERSFQNRGAPADAARVARTAAVGKGKRVQADNTDRGEAAETGEEDEL